MEDWAEVRRLHRAEGLAIKAIVRRTGLARNTVRAALASDDPPRYRRAARGSQVDVFEPEVRRLLGEFPDMPATVLAERVGYSGSASVFRARVATLRPLFRPADPADRTQYRPGEIVQCDLWFPPRVVPVPGGELLAPPVLTMVSAYSRWVMARAVPTRGSGDLLAGMWSLLTGLGGVPKVLVWDNEAGIGQHRRLTVAARGFAGTLGTRIWQARPRDPETKGVVERANRYLQTSFLPGRVFTGPEDFNDQLGAWLVRANTRLVRATGHTPAELVGTDRAAMGVLPPVPPRPVPPAVVRLGRDYYVRAAGNDYSVDPAVIGRMVSVEVDLSRVRVSCAGRPVADHPRSWAHARTVTDPDHLAAARSLRHEYQTRTRAAGPAAGTTSTDSAKGWQVGNRVAQRSLSDYDQLFGLEPPAAAAAVADRTVVVA